MDFLIISLFSLRTFIRAKDWNSNVSLFAHDVREGPENPIMMDQLALALYLEGKTDAALSYAEKSVALAPDVRNLSHLGILYAEKKRYSEAIVAHTRALDLYTRHAKDTRKTADFLVSVEDEHAENSYMNLAHTYLMLKRPDKARALISQQGLRQLPTSPRLYFVLALAEYEAGSKQNALEAINKSYQLAPYHLTDTIRAKMKNGLPVDFRSFAL